MTIYPSIMLNVWVCGVCVCAYVRVSFYVYVYSSVVCVLFKAEMLLTQAAPPALYSN